MSPRAALVILALLAARPAFAVEDRQKTIAVPGAQLEIVLSGRWSKVSDRAIFEWIEHAGRSVAAYYLRFPLPRARIHVEERRGDQIHGTTYEWNGGDIELQLGRDVTQDALDFDWVMTHEMLHLCFPTVLQHWLEEGLSTYVEPIARVRAGYLPPERVWRDLVRDLHQGLPKDGDRGLDRTPTWGRTYWGGCLYFLLADVEIRARTKNQKGLEDALRAIAAAGGTVAAHWTPAQIFEIGDRATGVPVLQGLYEAMKNDPHPVDLPALWRRLGIVVENDRVRFDANAELAAVRQAITAR